ncbi:MULTISPECIES: ABC transporter ATP-binding protein [Thermomonosporaceae]|uniref:ABC transporter ATP-binding protein n=1 Tax=Thermomonosporaceae TaxID=2012 RepID=UPI00255A789C|nr:MULTISPECIES: betaine/proline/choline family ABC transporter ATP-binding protein [Thermomonosporaceae]MDL4777458.1 betaine/proline/choline family ABC transporter ATP-binding protein [Actinomadura xylanilytica]
MPDTVPPVPPAGPTRSAAPSGPADPALPGAIDPGDGGPPGEAASAERGGIQLINVTKRFPGQATPAVDNVSLTVDGGEIVVLLGPSGSGKTTTMRLINRLIEPTSGKIIVAGRDALGLDPNDLRRQIGYVIQNAGLFPHMTVGTNVGLVPQMLGWGKARIKARVDELLQLVDLAPDQFRDRYPRELSGGQQQRVGVARALAADPPAMLMDEPFGALDPITREHLQDELLQLQEELGKTIVFVTHDVDEALKLGDRIAILDKGSRIVQYATPKEILLNPADEYVEQFLGGGQAMKLLKFSRVADVPLQQVPQAAPGDDAAAVRAQIDAAESTFAIVLDERDRPVRWITVDDLDGLTGPIGDHGTGTARPIRVRNTLQQALEALIQVEHEWVPVVGPRGVYRGTVTLSTLQTAIKDMKEQTRSRRRQDKAADS